MAKRKRRVFTDGFKADAVRLGQAGGRGIGQVARDLGETALRAWLKLADDKAEMDRRPAGTLTTAERSELRRRARIIDPFRRRCIPVASTENSPDTGSILANFHH